MTSRLLPSASVLLRRGVALCTIASLGSIATVASADGAYVYKPSQTEVHGSQVASSEWLPIIIGGAAGLVVGGLGGSAFDDRQPPVFGALVGAGVGGFTGGAGGAWLIRGYRDQDTRVAGALTGLGVGVGLGSIIFAKTITSDQTGTKAGGVAGLILLPVIGIFAGRSLAIYLGSKPKKEAAPAPVAMMHPNVAPIVTPGLGTTGMTLGLDGVF